MELRIDGNNLVVTKEQGEKGFYASRSAWGDADSKFLYYLKNKLNQPDCEIFPPDSKGRPIVWIKKRMWKDGHMVDEREQYLRSKDPLYVGSDSTCEETFGVPVYICLSSNHWQIHGSDIDFNEGKALLQIDFIPVCKPQLDKRHPERIAEQSDKNMAQIDRQLGIK